mgnify:CR=1 FL=1
MTLIIIEIISEVEHHEFYDTDFKDCKSVGFELGAVDCLLLGLKVCLFENLEARKSRVKINSSNFELNLFLDRNIIIF